MNTRTTASVVLVSSLALLLTGCAGSAVESGEESSERGPAGSHIVTDRLTQSLSGEALREFKGSEPRVAERSLSDDVRRELKGSEPVEAERSLSDEVRRELKGSEPRVAERSFTDEVRRELKGAAPATESPTDGG